MLLLDCYPIAKEVGLYPHLRGVQTGREKKDRAWL